MVAQRLLRRADGRGRVAAIELLFGTPAVANLIREKKTFQLASIMQTSKRDGMVTFEDAVLQLVRQGLVAPEDALGHGMDLETLENAARGIVPRVALPQPPSLPGAGQANPAELEERGGLAARMSGGAR